MTIYIFHENTLSTVIEKEFIERVEKKGVISEA